MPVPRQPQLAASGPWRGLNTTLPAENLHPAFARDCLNVSLAEGQIACRPGMVDAKIPVLLQSGIRTLFQWDRDAGGAQDVLVLFQTGEGALWAGKPDQGTVVQLLGNGFLQYGLATYVVFNRRVYIADGGDRVYQTDGTPSGTGAVGIRPPPPPESIEYVIGQEGDPDDHNMVGEFTYALSLARGIENELIPEAESDAVFVPDVMFIPVRQLPPNPNGRIGVKITLPDVSNKNGQMYNLWRIYRRDLTREDPAHWLIRDIPSDRRTFVDRLPSASYEQGPPARGPVFGPFAPTRNGVPPAARMLAVYKDRMFYAGSLDASLLYYSALAHPDHVSADDYILVGGDANDVITGLVVSAGQLVIGKPGSIWILSGAIVSMTNELEALGGETPESFHQIYPTRVETGPVNKSGNSFIACGNPERIYYNAADGLRSFDGVASVSASAAIRGTWERFATPGPLFPQFMTFAYDPKRDRLLICNGGSVNPQTASVLCLHLNLGAWAPWERAGGGRITALASTFGRPDPQTPGFILRYGVALAAVEIVQEPNRYGRPGYFADDADGDEDNVGRRTPFDFRWVSGKLSLGAPGIRKHASLATWRHAAAANLSARLGFVVDGENPLTAELAVKLLGESGVIVERVGRTGFWFTFVVRPAENEPRRVGLSIAGVSLALEAVGHW